MFLSGVCYAILLYTCKLCVVVLLHLSSYDPDVLRSLLGRLMLGLRLTRKLSLLWTKRRHARKQTKQ